MCRVRFSYRLSLRIQQILLCQVALRFTDLFDKTFMPFSMALLMVRKLHYYLAVVKVVVHFLLCLADSCSNEMKVMSHFLDKIYNIFLRNGILLAVK